MAKKLANAGFFDPEDVPQPKKLRTDIESRIGNKVNT